MLTRPRRRADAGRRDPTSADAWFAGVRWLHVSGYAP
jgi:hypothetical protein